MNDYRLIIKKLILDSGLSVEDCAKKLKITKQTLYNLLEGRTQMKVEQLYDIAEILNTPVINLLGETSINIGSVVSSNLNDTQVSMNNGGSEIDILKLKIKELEREIIHKDEIISLLKKLASK